MIKETLLMHWPNINFFENVLLVLTVPAEYPEEARHIMRKCVYLARLIEDMLSKNLQFVTECKYLHNLYLFFYNSNL